MQEQATRAAEARLTRLVQMAALPQCITSAKELYDLRERYKDASVLITAIYSESMVIAASLSQVQNLLQHDALRQKPQLLETFDRALTGCRVVYGCLEEEVRDLVEKAHRNDLKFRDRARYLWKEDTFKELLTQIRGQQSALSLLIQGLQMESMADMRKLVEDNSGKLDQIVKRSKTLRQTHPRVRVPESLFSYDSGVADASDAESISKSTHFEFDDQVINSKAYRRAMARYTMNPVDVPVDVPLDMKEPENLEIEVAEEDSTEIGTIQGPDRKRNSVTAARSQQLVANITSGSEDHVPMVLPKLTPKEQSPKEERVDPLDTLERDVLPYMPRITSTAPYLTTIRAGTFDTIETKVENTAARAPLRSFSEGCPIVPEASPPLPPRRTSGPLLRSKDSATTLKARSNYSDESLDKSEAESILSRVSEASSQTAYEFAQQSQTLSRKPARKPLPLAHKASHAVLGNLPSLPISPEPRSTGVPFENGEMHAVWLLVVEAERNFFDRMIRLRKMFYDSVIRQWPLLEPHLGIVLIGEQLAATNKKFLWLPMEQHLLDSEQAICDPAIFAAWIDSVRRIFHEYCQSLPHAIGALRATQNSDGKFTPFVNTLGLSIAYFGKSWEDYLRLPVTELDLCIESMRSLISIAKDTEQPGADREVQRITSSLNALIWLKSSSASVLEQSQSREDTQNLERRIHTMDTDILSQLSLLDTNRRVKYQGSMTMKLKSRGPWQAVHVVLLDNYLFWGKVKAQKKTAGDKVIVLDAVSTNTCLWSYILTSIANSS